MNMREVKTVQYDALHNTAASNKNIRSSLKARNYPGFSFAGGIFLLNTTEAAQQLSLSSPVSASAYARCFTCVASDLHCSNPLIRTMPATVLPLPQCTHATIPDTVISFKDSKR